MRSSSMTLAAFPLIALLGVLGAGCSSPSPSAAGTGTSGPGTTGGTATTVDRGKAVKFSECLRSNGVPDFPDPDAKGQYQYGVSVTPAVFQKAVDACKNLEPPGALGEGPRTPKEKSAALQFAQCMRDKGVKDFPDPVEGEPLINTYRIPSSNRPGGMAILDATIAKCRPALDKAAGGQ
jgi:hypothetical protein